MNQEIKDTIIGAVQKEIIDQPSDNMRIVIKYPNSDLYSIRYRIIGNGGGIYFVVDGKLNGKWISDLSNVSHVSQVNPVLRDYLLNPEYHERFRYHNIPRARFNGIYLRFEELNEFLNTIDYNISTVESWSNRLNKLEKVYWPKLVKKEIPVLDIILPLGEDCGICLNSLNETEVCGNMKCKHYFHCGCIQEWLENKNTCPICRADFDLFKVDDSRRFDFGKPNRLKLKQINAEINYLKNL
jgi:hypothetical protein